MKCLQFSLDDSSIAVAYADGQLYGYNTGTSETLLQMELGVSLVDMVYSPDGNTLAVAYTRGK